MGLTIQNESREPDHAPYEANVAARRYASAVYAVVVCPSVCLSHTHIVPKRLNVGSRNNAVR